jgi:hypothetical protein
LAAHAEGADVGGKLLELGVAGAMRVAQRVSHDLAQLCIHGALMPGSALVQFFLEIVVEVAQDNVSHRGTMGSGSG